MHLLSLNFPISTLFYEDDPVRRLSCQPRIGHASSENAVSFSSAWTIKRFPSPRCASTIHILRPLESTACRWFRRLLKLARLPASLAPTLVALPWSLALPRARASYP